MRLFKRGQKVFPLRNRFEGGDGVSLYLGPPGVDDPEKIVFRRPRFFNGQAWFPLSDAWTGGGEFFLHDSIVAQVNCPATEIEYTLPATYADGVFWMQLRTFEGGIELESLFRPQRVAVDDQQTGSGSIDGTAIITGVEKRDGGGVRIRFMWFPAVTGISPENFQLSVASGPTSPADVSIDHVLGQGNYLIDLESLQDAGVYSIDLQAVSGTVVKTLQNVSFTADATGPDQASSLIAEPC